MSCSEVQPEPHKLYMADWKDADGGVVVSRFQPFCRCGWSRRWSTRSRARAADDYEAHLAHKLAPVSDQERK